MSTTWYSTAVAASYFNRAPDEETGEAELEEMVAAWGVFYNSDSAGKKDFAAASLASLLSSGPCMFLSHWTYFYVFSLSFLYSQSKI